MSENDEGDSVDVWMRLNHERITALEDGNFDQALDLIERMRPHRFLAGYPNERQSRYLEREKERTQRLKDPFEKDATFRELLGVRTHAEVMAERNRDCSRYEIDFCEPEIHPIPCDSAITVKSRVPRFVHDNAISEVQLKTLEEIWRLQDCLLFRLRVSNNNSASFDRCRRVAHYCRADALPSILYEGLRLCSLSSANDPTEGRRFADFLMPFADVGSFKDRKESMLALQCSFSNRVNDLNQFRLYGRDTVSGGDGTGLCLEFNMGYFDNWGDDPVATVGSVRRQQIKSAKECARNHDFPGPDEIRLPLYWVLYYNAKDTVFYYTPRQCERPFSASTCEKKEEPGVFIYRDVLRSQQGIQKLLKGIGRAFTDLKELKALELGWDLCIYLRHLIKDAAFRDEQEMRVLKLFPVDDADVGALNGTGPLSSAYCPLLTQDEHSPLQRIIAGPKVKNIRQIRELVENRSRSRRMLDEIDVIQSDVPLA